MSAFVYSLDEAAVNKGGLEAGATAAIVITVLLIMVAAVVAGVMIAIIYHYKYKMKSTNRSYGIYAFWVPYIACYVFALLDNQTYFDPHAMKDNINNTQPTHANITTGNDGHYEMQNRTKGGYECEMGNGSQPGRVYEMGPTTTTEAHEMHYVNNIYSSITTTTGCRCIVYSSCRLSHIHLWGYRNTTLA